jgi:hypothetical protein
LPAQSASPKMGGAMPIETGRTADGHLLWVANPFTGVVTYLTDIHRKRNGFVPPPPPPLPEVAPVDFAGLCAACAFCPGNEAMTTEEVLRYPQDPHAPWQIRAFYNLFPRIPVECTGGRSESYVLVETPEHFRDDAAHADGLVYTAMLSPERFRAVLRAAARISDLSFANPVVRSVVVRKNQGRESGASQPHPHTQVIGSDRILAPLAREHQVIDGDPALFRDLVELAKHEGFVIGERDELYLFFSPIGAFPRSYEVVDLAAQGRLGDIEPARLDAFADLLRQGLAILGDTPLDYEIHADRGLPLHAHINARQFPYSNIAGTLNLPSGLLRGR